jgi:hypothetical protein
MQFQASIGGLDRGYVKKAYMQVIPAMSLHWAGNILEFADDPTAGLPLLCSGPV